MILNIIKRQSIWLKSNNAIQAHNIRFMNGKETFSMAHNAFSDMTLEEKKAHLGLKGHGKSQRNMNPLMLNVKQAARTTTRRPSTTRRLTTTRRPTTTRRLTTTRRPTTTRRLTTTRRPTTTRRLTTTRRPTTTRRLTTAVIVSNNTNSVDWRNTPGM
jgi:hypothetical protein